MHFRGSAFAFLLLILLLALPVYGKNINQKNTARPNIIIIMADDMGYSDLGCFGSEISTPNIDALAGEGLLFSHFYNAGRCCPTRASLMTGLYPHQTGIGHMTNDYHDPAYSGDLNQN